MSRNLAPAGAIRTGQRVASPMICFVVIMVLALGFWAGVVWLAEAVLHLAAAVGAR